MGKKKRQERLKLQQNQRQPLSGRDLVRLFPGLMLRAMIVVMPLTLVMTLLGGSGVTLFNNFWVQMACYLAAYTLFNNYIFGPIRNYRPTPTNKETTPKTKGQ